MTLNEWNSLKVGDRVRGLSEKAHIRTVLKVRRDNGMVRSIHLSRIGRTPQWCGEDFVVYVLSDRTTFVKLST